MIRSLPRLILCAALAAGPMSWSPLQAQEQTQTQAQSQAPAPAALSGLARFDPETSRVADTNGGVQVDLDLSQGVPYRAYTLDAPKRLVLDFREVDFSTLSATRLLQGDKVLAVRAGKIRPGWSRMVLDLNAPLVLRSANMAIDRATGRAALSLWLEDTDADEFAASAGVPDIAGWAPPKPGEGKPPVARDPHGPLRVMLDPGHGGIDPGAEADGAVEKELMLSFARQLKEVLLRGGDVEVMLTREDDHFVSLERRVAIAHERKADIFISLHADALSEGGARGATVYTLDPDASDAASRALAERHERDDLLSGVDLSQSDDVVADVLMDLARLESRPRSDLLARAIVLALREEQLPVNNHALRAAGFSVLKSPDIPSVLLELGFLSSESDRGNLLDEEWRNHMAVAVADAIRAWAIADEAAAELVRQ